MIKNLCSVNSQQDVYLFFQLSIYLSLKFCLLNYQGIDGGPGEKGEDGESGQPVSINNI